MSMTAVTPNSGFLRLREGIFDHLRDGRMHPVAFAIYLVILHQCDWRAGIWLGSAWRLYDSLGQTIKRKTIQDNIARLCRAGYLKSLRGVGRRGNYYVLVNKYRPTIGELIGYELNVGKSTSLKDLVFDSVIESGVTTNWRWTDGRLTTNCGRTDGRPYQDVQDLQDCKISRLEEVVDETKAAITKNQNPAQNQDQNLPAMDKADKLLLQEMRRIWDCYGWVTYNFRPEHHDQALAFARQYGYDEFLDAYEYWTYYDSRDQIKTGKDDDENLTFQLPKFLSQVEHYVEEAKKDRKFLLGLPDAGKRVRFCPQAGHPDTAIAS